MMDVTKLKLFRGILGKDKVDEFLREVDKMQEILDKAGIERKDTESKDAATVASSVVNALIAAGVLDEEAAADEDLLAAILEAVVAGMEASEAAEEERADDEEEEGTAADKDEEAEAKQDGEEDEEEEKSFERAVADGMVGMIEFAEKQIKENAAIAKAYLDLEGKIKEQSEHIAELEKAFKANPERASEADATNLGVILSDLGFSDEQVKEKMKEFEKHLKNDKKTLFGYEVKRMPE